MDDNAIIDLVLKHEGIDFTNDPDDPGGCTKFGITRKTLQDWRGRLTTCLDVRDMTEQEARDIYKARYVRPFDGVEDDIKPQVVDIAVNSGVLTARTMLAMAQADTSNKSLNTRLFIQRMKHYVRIVKAHAERRKYLGGWFNRSIDYLA